MFIVVYLRAQIQDPFLLTKQKALEPKLPFAFPNETISCYNRKLLRRNNNRRKRTPFHFVRPSVGPLKAPPKSSRGSCIKALPAVITPTRVRVTTNVCGADSERESLDDVRKRGVLVKVCMSSSNGVEESQCGMSLRKAYLTSKVR